MNKLAEIKVIHVEHFDTKAKQTSQRYQKQNSELRVLAETAIMFQIFF